MADFDPDKYLEKKKKSEPFDPDKYLASTKPETALQTLGRSSASLADTAINTVRGLADIPVRAVSRAYYGGLKGVPLEQQEQLLQNVSNAILPQQDVVGKIFGVTGTPGYEKAPLRRLGTAVGETIGENVIQPIASATGLPEGYVGDVVNLGTAAVAPAVPKVASATVSAGKKAMPLVTTPYNVGKGFYQGARGVEPGSAKSAVVPLRENYYPPEAVQAYMRGEMDLATLQASQRPSSSLFATPEQQSALRMAERMPGEGNVPLIPVQGKSAQAFGERVGREYVTDPYRAAADVGLSVIAGVPLPLSAAQRAMQARQSRTLSQAAQFDPMFRQKLLTDIEAQANMPVMPPAPGPVNPATIPSYPLTVQGQGQQLPPSVIPAPDLSRRVNIEGQPFTLPSQINTSQSQTARAMPTPQQMAIEKTQQIAQQAPRPVQRQAVQQVQQAPVPAPSQSMFAGQPLQAKAAPAPQPTPTEVTNLGKLGLREGKKAIKEAETSGVPTKFEMFEKGKGYTTYTFNKDIKFKPDPDLKLNRAIEYNNGNKDFSGVLSSTGEPVTVKLVKDKDITVYNSSGDIIKQFDTKGNLTFERKGAPELSPEAIKSLEANQATLQRFNEEVVKRKKKGPSNVSKMMLEQDPNYGRFTIKMPDNIKQGMGTKEGVAAMMRESGEWTANNMKYKMEEVAGGQTRLQVRDMNGKVIYERYY